LDIAESGWNGGPVMENRKMPQFSDPMCFQVWAAVDTLDVSLQFEVLRELASRFATATLRRTTPEERVRKAVMNLHTAADIYGQSPSVTEYRTLQEQLPELNLAPDGTIRRWLGGGWNDCLRVALLDTVSDGDFAARPSAATNRFSNEELYAAVRNCTADLGHPPSMGEFFQWVRRPDVKARPGRRPRSYHPFQRLGGFRAVLIGAGVLKEGEGRNGIDGRLLPQRYAYSREELIEALITVAARLAGPLTVWRYVREREAIHRKAQSRGELVSLPSADTIRGRFGSWNLALAAAGLPADKSRQPSFTGGKRPGYTREEKINWLKTAWVEIGEPFTGTAYDKWQKTRPGRIVDPAPSLSCIRDTLGGWRVAAQLARHIDE
jgi:hypothetical protein